VEEEEQADEEREIQPMLLLWLGCAERAIRVWGSALFLCRFLCVDGSSRTSRIDITPAPSFLPSSPDLFPSSSLRGPHVSCEWQEGDAVLEIDGKPCARLSMPELRGLVSGAPGSSVRVGTGAASMIPSHCLEGGSYGAHAHSSHLGARGCETYVFFYCCGWALSGTRAAETGIVRSIGAYFLSYCVCGFFFEIVGGSENQILVMAARAQ
jgi:hypothetical protein